MNYCYVFWGEIGKKLLLGLVFNVASVKLTMVVEMGQRKVVGRNVAIVLGLICIVLGAGLVTFVALYVPTSNTIDTLKAQVAERDENITSLNRQIQALANAYAQLSQSAGSNSDTATQIADLQSSILYWQNIVYMNVTETIYSGQALHLDAGTNQTLFNDVLGYAGYLRVQLTSSSNTTYVAVYGSSLNGVSFDKTVVFGTGGTAYFLVLPSNAQVVIGNTEATSAVDVNFTIVYVY